MSKIATEQSRMHGKELSEAVKAEHVDRVPGNDAAHAHSHAAHLGTEGKVHTSPEGYGKQGRELGTENQPPQDPTRNGKTHRHD